MEIIKIDRDITVFYIKANSFPDGIAEAQEKFYQLIPPDAGRTYFGVSGWEDDGVLYRAGAEVKDGETTHLQYETLVLKKGNYMSILVRDYLENIHRIQEAFDSMFTNPDYDPFGYCIEWYLPEGKGGCNATDVKCLLRLKD